jgi:hypothetical protein
MQFVRHAAVVAYTQAWTVLDIAEAKALLLQCWTEDSEIIGPGYYFKGTLSVLNEIERFHREQPGRRAILTSEFDSHGDWTRFTIAMIESDGTKSHEGWDIIEEDGHGKIRRVISFWGSLPPPSP